MNRWLVIFRRFTLPGGLLVLLTALLCGVGGAASVAESAWQAVLVASTLAVIVLAVRFHLYRVALATVLLGLAAFASSSPLPAATMTHECLRQLLWLVVPANLLILFLIQESSFDGESLSWWAGLVALQAGILLMAAHSMAQTILLWLLKPLLSVALWAEPLVRPTAVATVLLLAAIAAMVLWKHRPTDVGLFWGAVAIAVAQRLSANSQTVFYLCAALALGAGVLEAAYAVAFHDELTTLPSRRAYNRQMQTLGGEYSIAAVDIDFFKKFNDTYGHDVGDEVLRMVAKCLSEVTGGGKAYRCGGEEFSILFPHLGVEDSYEHVELLRQTIAATPFSVRGPDRRHRRPSSERRYAARTLKTQDESSMASVTVSIGLAEPSKDATSEEVAKWADQALYRAKEGGRNQVAVYSTRRSSKNGKPDAPSEKEPFR